MTRRIVVLGAGAWGIATSVLLSRNPVNRISLWITRPETACQVIKHREHKQLLPGVIIPDSIELTSDVGKAASGATLCISAIPTIYLRACLEQASAKLNPDCPVVSLTKGLEQDTFLRPSQMIQQIVGSTRIAVLSGPSHAEEVSKGLPTTVVIACESIELASELQHLFRAESFRVYTNQDVIGVELAGALKNVMGIAAGISDGLDFGDNAKAALLTRGLVEMARFGVALGSEHSTFFGLAGLGDLITTCTSRHGRNRAVGERLGRGESLEQILASMSQVAEGINTARSVHEKAQRMSLDMPITEQIYRVLYEGKHPRMAVQELMLRQPRNEG